MIRRSKKIMVLFLSLVIVSFLSFISHVERVEAEEQNIIEYALSFVGNRSIPYVYGGCRHHSLEEFACDGSECNTRPYCHHSSARDKTVCGTDCSGFVSLVYQHFGVIIPTTSSSIYSSPKATKFTNINDALPGDICWWEGHVALYIGQGKIVHTNTSDTTNNNNLIHVSIINEELAGAARDYRVPTYFIRFVDMSDASASVFGDVLDFNTSKAVSNAIAKGTLVTESDLTGMPTEWSLVGLQEDVYLPSIDDLPISDRLGVQSIGDGIKNGKMGIVSLFSNIVIIVGYASIIYAIFIAMAAIFDKANTVIDVSLLSVVSFGKWYLVEEDEAEVYNIKGKKFINIRGVIYRICIVLLIGILLVSGVVSKLILHIVSTIIK